jgi:hypothetical protein
MENNNSILLQLIIILGADKIFLIIVIFIIAMFLIVAFIIFSKASFAIGGIFKKGEINDKNS